MPVDPSIYSMIRPQERQPGPLENYGSMLQLRGMADASDLNALHRQKLQGDLDEETAFKSKISDWIKAGGNGQLPPDAYAASPTRAAAFDKSRLDATKSQAELAEKKMATLAKGMDVMHKLAPTVRDEASWQAFNDTAHRVLGPEMVKQAGLPGQYDPEWVKRFVVKGDDMFTPKPQTVNLGGKEVVIDMNPFTNPKVVGMQLDKTLTPGERAQQGKPVWDEARGVFVTPPGGATPGGAPAGGAPAAPGAGGVVRPAGLPPKPTDVHNLRNEFNALPEVKQFRDVLPIIESARTTPDTRAGDIQLAYAVGKILDPNSVVREGELKMSADAQTTLARYYGEIQSAVTGNGRLSPVTRGELVKMLDNAVTQRETSYKQAEATYRGIAEKNGIPVDQVIVTPMKRSGQAAQPDEPAQPKLFDQMPDPAKYKGRRLQADDGTVYESDGSRWVRQGRK